MPKYFFITGLPRSRTAWLCGLFNTSQDVICLHEPINQFGTWEKVCEYIETLPYKYVGICDSSMGLHHEVLIDHFSDYPLVLINRDELDVVISLSKFLGISKTDAAKVVHSVGYGLTELALCFNKVKAFYYYSLERNEAIKELWQHCVGDTFFDEKKCDLFQKLIINQHKEKVLIEMQMDAVNILNDN